MTGFGRAATSSNGIDCTVEIRTVNHRFLDIKIRRHGVSAKAEAAAAALVRNALARGSASINIRVTHNNVEELYSEAAAKRVCQQLTRMRDACGLTSPLPLSLILSQPGVRQDESSDDDQTVALVSAATKAALEELVQSRSEEGRSLEEDLRARLVSLEEKRLAIASQASDISAEIAARLKERLSALLEDNTLDPARLAQEVALLADKADVTEELVRLETHIQSFTRCLGKNEATGKRLNFLVQEIGREINTIGSKAQQVSVTELVIDCKSLMEQIREQIQNIE